MLNKLLYLSIVSFIIGSEIDKKFDYKSSIIFAGVEFKLIKNGESPNRYIWLHGDEQTARMALEHHIGHFQGVAFFIQNKNREIPYKSTIVDPNRIFSRSGAYHALRKFKPGWPRGVLKRSLDEIDEGRKKFLNILLPDNTGLLISVHNNFRGYNVFKEKDKSQKVSIKSNENPRDFIICTNPQDYDKLSNGPYNVVLQNKLPEHDDGSLSWEALRNNVRYLNIETRLGYLSKQKKMLRFVEHTLN